MTKNYEELSRLREKKGLEGLRNELEEVDRKIINLVEKRLKIADEVAIAKKEKDLDIEDEKREEKVIENAVGQAQTLDIDEEVIKDLVCYLIEASKKRQRETK